MIRNLSLYPAELRGLRGFPPFLPMSAAGQAEQNGAIGHIAARRGHNVGHASGMSASVVMRPVENFGRTR